MEKEHKSKNKIHKVKVKVAPAPNVEEVHTQKVVEKKTVTPKSQTESHTETMSVKKEVKGSDLGKFPKDPVSPPTKKEKITIPSYIFIAGIFVIAFGIGGAAAKFLPMAHWDFKFKNEAPVATEVVESTIAAEPAPVIPPEKPKHVIKTPAPQISARAYGIYNLVDGEYLELTSKDSKEILPMASVTKVMTAIVAMEEYDLDKTVAIPAKCVGINGSSVGFRANDVFTLQDLLYGLLVKSGADAACAIANIDNETEFIGKMNAKAQELDMIQTKFTNAVGFDNSYEHVSNVEDLKTLVTYALNYSTFRKVVGTGEITLTSKSTGAPYRIRNTNELLFSIPGTVGIKTGYTDSAGECLTYLYQNKDQEILIVILGSLDRFGDTSKLLEWAKSEIISY